MALHDKSMTQTDQPRGCTVTILATMDEQNTQTGHARRPSGRDAKRAARAARAGSSIPYITRRIPYYEVLTEEGLALMEHNADTILEEIGIDFRDDPEALDPPELLVMPELPAEPKETPEPAPPDADEPELDDPDHRELGAAQDGGRRAGAGQIRFDERGPRRRS